MKHTREFIAYLAKDALDNLQQPDTQAKLIQFSFTTGLSVPQCIEVIKGLYEENRE